MEYKIYTLSFNHFNRYSYHFIITVVLLFLEIKLSLFVTYKLSSFRFLLKKEIIVLLKAPPARKCQTMSTYTQQKVLKCGKNSIR